MGDDYRNLDELQKQYEHVDEPVHVDAAEQSSQEDEGRKKFADRLDASWGPFLNKAIGGTKKISWGMLLLAAVGLYAVYKLVSTVIFFFG
ncbi:MAG: hypothetical protein IJ584_03015 [Bacteroidales bacterium]|nr:hypothetical protein [Bacteroidales bacterium]